MKLPLDKREPAVEYKPSAYITLTPYVYAQICSYVDNIDTEISGFGLVTVKELQIGDKDKQHVIREYYVDEIFVPHEQEVSACKSDIEADVLGKLVEELLQQGKDTSKLKFHWHSHCHMGVHHSMTDIDNYRLFAGNDFFISLLTNKKGEFVGRLDINYPIVVGVAGIPVYVESTARIDVDAIKDTITKIKDFNKESTKVYGFKDWRGHHKFTRDTDVVSPGTQSNKCKDIVLREIDNDTKDKKLTLELDNLMVIKARAEIRKRYGIGKKTARAFEKCRPEQGDCAKCRDSQLCQMYLWELLEATGGY